MHATSTLIASPYDRSEYEAAREAFSWDRERGRLDGLPGGRGLNIAHEAVDRHAAGDAGLRTALRFLGKSTRTELTYRQLAEATSRFANVLRGLGVAKGERVFSLAGRIPELYIAALGTLKNGSVFCPLFSVFGPEPIFERMELGDARVLVTTPSVYRRKVAPLRDALPNLEHVILAGAGDTTVDCCLSFDDLMTEASPRFEIPPTDPEDMALLHFTSGTTGTPKGAVHVHDAVVAHHATARTVLDLRDDDVYWCTADPGWVTGTSYGMIAPLTAGVTLVIDEREFDAEAWYRTLQDEGVTVWYTAPTALRMLMRAGADLARAFDLSKLRLVLSVGEPLGADAVAWSEEAFGIPVHDTWWQTETGGIMVANLPAVGVRPGAMGLPLPGVDAVILQRGDDGRAAIHDGHVIAVDGPNVEGELALRAGWPSMFRGYLHDRERYDSCFADGWYLTGDVAFRDADGWLWFVGRADDVIKSAGHLIGPVEIEHVLREHPAVFEAGAIGIPDPVAGEVVKAFVSLRPGHHPSDELRLELLGHARSRLGPAVAPREIAFHDHLPHTKSGKILRRLLRARELGLPEGDLSTVEVHTS